MAHTVNYAQADGYWDVGSNWSLTHAPTATEEANISASYDMILRTGYTNTAAYVDIDGGSLTFQSGSLLITDQVSEHTPKWHIRIHEGNYTELKSTATSFVGALLRSSNLQPTNKINFLVERSGSSLYPNLSWMNPGSGSYTYIQPDAFSWFLGNSNTYIWFNNPTAYGKAIWATTASWPDRTPIISSHTIDGRTGDRVFREGIHSGTVELSGVFQMPNRPDMDLMALRDTSVPLCLITPYVTLSKCYVESLRFRPGPGSAYVGFNMTLIEDL